MSAAESAAARGDTPGGDTSGAHTGTFDPRGPAQRAIAFLVRWKKVLLAWTAILALIFFAELDWSLFSNGYAVELPQVVQDETEVWIAAAASIGLYATARHVSNLADAIRTQSNQQAEAGASPEEDAPGKPKPGAEGEIPPRDEADGA